MKIKCFMLLLSCLIFSHVHAQKKVYFPYFELINVEKDGGLQYSTSKLLKAYIENAHDFTILLPEKSDESYYQKEALDQSRQKAVASGADYLLLGEIHNLQGSFVISLSMYETNNLDKVWTDVIKGANSEDLDPLLSRLGRTFMTNNRAKNDIEIDEVTNYEQQGVELLQIRVNHFVGVMIGGSYLLSENTLSGFGASYSYDATTVIFNMNFEFYPTSSWFTDEEDETSKKFHAGNFNLGVIYPLSRKRLTWYLKGGMEYGFLRLKREYPEINDIEGGIGVFGGAGYLINRNSTVNVRIETALSYPTYQVNGRTYPAIKFGIITSFSR